MKNVFLVVTIVSIVFINHLNWEGNIVNGEPIGCSKHSDDIHQKKAEGCGYRDDFHCRNAK